MDPRTDERHANLSPEANFQSMSLDSQSKTESLVRRYQRYIWLICSITSVLSARCLLIERSFHFPVHLYISQTVATAAVALYLHAYQRKELAASDKERWSRLGIQAMLLTAASHCLVAMATFCALQAILHFTNLPVLMMLMTIAFFAEGLLLTILRLTPFSRMELIRLGLLGLACAGIMSKDHRLEVPGLVSSTLAMLFTGSSSALRKLIAKLYPSRTVEPIAEIKWIAVTCNFVAIVWLLGPWNQEQTFEFDWQHAPLLALNACATAAATLIGTSIFFPRDVGSAVHQKIGIDGSLQTLSSVAMVMIITAIMGCYSSLVVRRSYTSWDQIWCFALAILCVSSKAICHVYLSLSDPKSGRAAVYQPIHRSLSAENSHNTAFFDDEGTGLNNVEAPRLCTRSLKTSMTLAVVALAALWTPYLILNFKQETALDKVVLDRNYSPNLPAEVVISMYNEPIDDVAELIQHLRNLPRLSDIHATIYTKDEAADIKHIKQYTRANDVIILPNVGREGETYLNHVLTRWDTLAAETIFLQAHIHNPREFYARLKRYYRPHQTGFLSLGWSGVVCEIEDCTDNFSWRDRTHLFPQVQARISNSTRSKYALLNYKGQFIVSAARIRGIDRGIYHDLREAMVDEKSWAHREPYLQGQEDSMSQPFFGYTMERIWNLLFQCSDMQVAWKCPSMISRWRSGGNMGDCQCFDT